MRPPWLKSPVDRWGAATVAVAAVIGSLGLVIAVLGTIAAIDTWTDVDEARADLREAAERRRKGA
jgi:hypothetical protein